jgi:hypothetical protein
MEKKRNLVRGAVTLAVLGAITAGALMVPAGAASFATKKFVNRKIKKLSSDVIHQPVFYRQSAQFTVPANLFEEGFVACPAGTSALGGGVSPQTNGTTNYFDINVEASHPSTGAAITAGTTGWSAGVENELASPVNFRVYVICAAAQKDVNYTEGSPAARLGATSGRE